MGPGYFIIAIMGCADGSSTCTPLATVPTHYASSESCAAARGEALMANSDLDAPNLIAECRSVTAPRSASQDRVAPVPVDAVRG